MLERSLYTREQARSLAGLTLFSQRPHRGFNDRPGALVTRSYVS